MQSLDKMTLETNIVDRYQQIAELAKFDGHKLNFNNSIPVIRNRYRLNKQEISRELKQFDMTAVNYDHTQRFRSHDRVLFYTYELAPDGKHIPAGVLDVALIPNLQQARCHNGTYRSFASGHATNKFSDILSEAGNISTVSLGFFVAESYRNGYFPQTFLALSLATLEHSGYKELLLQEDVTASLGGYAKRTDFNSMVGNSDRLIKEPRASFYTKYSSDSTIQERRAGSATFDTSISTQLSAMQMSLLKDALE